MKLPNNDLCMWPDMVCCKINTQFLFLFLSLFLCYLLSLSSTQYTHTHTRILPLYLYSTQNSHTVHLLHKHSLSLFLFLKTQTCICTGMVTHSLVPYSLCVEAGLIQDKILDDICKTTRCVRTYEVIHPTLFVHTPLSHKQQSLTN